MATTWTDLPKPQGTTSVVAFEFVGGTPLGLMLAITTSSIVGVTSVVTSLWTDVPVNTASWTDVPKAS